MERRLEGLLSRIAMETQEIKELEQQLTDGQILANEALKKDLEGVISGLQQYIKSLRAQTSHAQQKVQSLQLENLHLRRHLEDTDRCSRQLEEQTYTQSESHRRMLRRLSGKLQELRRAMSEADSISGEQLLWAVDQLEDLNRFLDCLKDQSEEDKLTETQPEIHLTRMKSGSKSRSKPRTDTKHRSMTKARLERQDVESCLIDPCNMSVGSGATQDSGLDLHLLSSPEKAPPTGATGNCLNIPMTTERQHHQHTETNHSEEEEDSGSHCSTAVGPAEGAHRQRDRLRVETEKLQRTLRKHRRVLGVCEEVWCVEQTLMKRRAELRQAQRLLQEAYSSTSQAQYEAEEWQRRAKDSATCLQQTQLQLKELQDEVKTLRKSRQVQILNQSPHLDLVWSQGLDQLTSLRNQEEQLQQRTKDLRDQETRLKTTLQSLVEQQKALLSQRSSLVSITSEEEQGLENLRSELDSTRNELKRLLEEVCSERQELLNLKTLQSKELKKLQKTQLQIDQTGTELDHTQDLLDRIKYQADQTETALNQAKDQLGQTVSELLMKQEEVRQKEEEVTEKRRKQDQLQAAVDKKRAELTALQQEVEIQQKEAESCLREGERQTRYLQEVKKDVEQRKEQSSTLQQQCRHLEDRRRHAHRCLSAVEAELQKQQRQSLLTQQRSAANQEKLNESSELLSFLGEKVEERKVQLQTLEQELSVLSEKHKQKQSELQELEHRAHTQALAAVAESKNRGCGVTQEQLHTLSEELWERENRLLEREAELRHKEEGLYRKEAELILPKEEELPSELDNSDKESSKEFYLSTAVLRSASSPEVQEERWRVEMETDQLELKQDSLRARLRCSLRSQDQSLQERDLETEQSLRGLRHRVDCLDSLLLRTQTHK